MPRRLLFIGAVSAFVGVAAGAFGAHALEGHLQTDLLAVYETGVRYELVHALGLVLAGLAADRWPGVGWERAGWMFLVGTILFSGSLYVLALAGARWLGAVTPLGGACFLLGWLMAARAALRSGTGGQAGSETGT